MTPWPYPTGELWKYGMYFAGLKQNHITHQKQHLYAKPCGAYDGYYMLSPCNYALPNPASQWQHWSLAVNVDTVLTTYHILIYIPYIGKLTRESMHTSAAVPTSAFRQTNSKQWRAWQQWQHQNTVSNKTFIRYHGDSLCLLLPESSWKTYSCFSNCTGIGPISRSYKSNAAHQHHSTCAARLPLQSHQARHKHLPGLGDTWSHLLYRCGLAILG